MLASIGPLLALDKLGPELVLELAYLHRQCRLADRTFLGGTPEMAVTGVLQIAPSVHLDHFSRCGAVSPLAPVDVGRVVALFGEVGHEGMMGR